MPLPRHDFNRSYDFELPNSFIESLKKLSADRKIDVDVLVRLALYDFLVKFNNYKGDASEREKYQFLYDHFAVHPAVRTREKYKEPERTTFAI